MSHKFSELGTKAKAKFLESEPNITTCPACHKDDSYDFKREHPDSNFFDIMCLACDTRRSVYVKVVDVDDVARNELIEYPCEKCGFRTKSFDLLMVDEVDGDEIYACEACRDEIERQVNAAEDAKIKAEYDIGPADDPDEQGTP